MGLFDEYLPENSPAPAPVGKQGLFDEYLNPEPTPFTSTVKSTGASMLNAFAGQPIEDLGETVGSQGLQSFGKGVRQYAEGVQKANPSSINSLSDIAEHPWDAVKTAVGNVVPQIPVSLASAAAGAGLGAMTPIPGGAVIGGAIGAFAPNYLQEAAEMRSKQHETGQEDMAKAYGYAVPAAGLETAADVFALGKLMPKGLGKFAGDTLEEGASRIAHVGKQAAKGFGAEAGTEYAQTALEQFGGNQPLDTEDAANERNISAALGGIGGGAIRGGLSAFDSRQVAQPTPETGPAWEQPSFNDIKNGRTGPYPQWEQPSYKVSPLTGEPIPEETESSGALGKALNAGAITTEIPNGQPTGLAGAAGIQPTAADSDVEPNNTVAVKPVAKPTNPIASAVGGRGIAGSNEQPTQLDAQRIVDENTRPGIGLQAAIDQQYQDGGYNPFAGAWETPYQNDIKQIANEQSDITGTESGSPGKRSATSAVGDSTATGQDEGIGAETNRGADRVAFQPTHELFGEPVRQIDDGLFVDADGIEIEDSGNQATQLEPSRVDNEQSTNPTTQETAATEAVGNANPQPTGQQAPNVPTTPLSQDSVEPVSLDGVPKENQAVSDDQGVSSGLRKGEVGGMMSPKEQVLTSSGRKTTPFPSGKKPWEVDKWLLENAHDEAVSRGDNFNARIFKSDIQSLVTTKTKNRAVPQASKDSAEEYLFGRQPDVVPSILKPLIPNESIKQTPEVKPVSPNTPANPSGNAAQVGAGEGRSDVSGAAKVEFHPGIEQMASDLHVGGGIAYTYDEFGNINGRTPSLNPSWFQSGFTITGAKGEETKTPVSVKDIKRAVDTWKRGEALTGRQTRILTRLSEIATDDEREANEAWEREKLSEELWDAYESTYANIDLSEVSENDIDEFFDDLNVTTLSAQEAEDFWGAIDEEANKRTDARSLSRSKEGSDSQQDDFLQPIDGRESTKSKSKQQAERTVDLFAESDEEQKALKSKQAVADAAAKKDTKRNGDGKVDSELFDNPALNGQTDIADTNYGKNEPPINLKVDGNDNDTRGTRASSDDAGKAPDQPRVSNQQSGSVKQTGNQGSDKELRGRQGDSVATDTVESAGNELSADDRVVGLGANGGNQQDVGKSDGIDGRVSGDSGAANYDLRDKPPISLTPAKRRDVNNLAVEILNKPVEDITEADKNILRQYTGNGGLSAQDSVDKGAGIFNQHYTDYTTIREMYRALQEAGVKMDKMLEPSSGSGNFIGMFPDADWSAVDIDGTNTEIVKRLYPKAQVFNESYETFRGKNFDVIISNVPFASVSALPREHMATVKPAFKAIHNFFFAQSVDKLKTGGVMAFMTSTGTMDGTGEAANLRKMLIGKMDVIGAFRLPMGTQKANASTEVMIDVIFLQKRPEGIESKQSEKNNAFANVISKDGHKINQYFVEYPDSVLGDLSIGKNKTSMGKVGWIVTGEPDYSAMKLEYQDYTATQKADKSTFKDQADAQQYADKHGFKFVDGVSKPYFEDGVVYDKPISYSDVTGGGLLGRAATGVYAEKMKLLKAIDDSHDQELVNKYESTYGKPPHDDKMLQIWAKNNYADQQLKSYLSLFDKHYNLSEIFKNQVRFEDSGKIEITSDSPLLDRAESLEDADGILSTKTDLLSSDEVQSLLDSGDYARISDSKIQNARLYYAGNIYQKIDAIDKVKPAAQRDKQLARLEKVKPSLIPIEQISITGKENWMPPSAIASIGKQTYRDGTTLVGMNAIDDNHLLHLYNAYLNGDNLVKKGKDETPEEYAERIKAAQVTLTTEVLPLIKQKLLDDGLADEVRDAYNRAFNFFAAPVFNGASLKNLPTTFRGKPFKLMQHQQEGAERAIYNKKGVLAFSPGLGKTPTAIVVADQLLQKGVMKKPLFIVPANTIPQWEATARDLYPNAKVFEFPKYQSGINKGKVKDWPSMTASDKEKMLYDLANNRYDYTFISTNLAQKFTIPEKTLSQYIDELVESVSGMEKPDEELNKSQIKAKERRLAKLRMLKRTMMDAYRDDSSVGFDIGKLGFDAIFADEVQYYKNIGMQSEDAKGGIGANVSITAKYQTDKDGNQNTDADPISVTLGSSRSYDFRFKTRYISEKNNGNNIFLLTGTPTPNKPLELMTLLHHLDTHILDEYGVTNVGDFVNEFFDVQDVEEVAIDGQNKLRPQLVGIKNIPALKKIITRYVDYRSPESAKDLTRPKQIDITHTILRNDVAELIFADIQERLIQAIEDGKAKLQGEKIDDAETVIQMYTAGRDASIDVRLYSPTAKSKLLKPGDLFAEETRADYSKIAKTVQLVAEQAKKDPTAGQLIFLDRLKFPGNQGSTHSDIRDKVIAATGLSPTQVVFVNGGEFVNPSTGKVTRGGPKPEMLQNIMDAYNAGDIKVLIGNTSKLGVGVDLQVHTTDIYQIDKLYRPDEIEQRNNRGVRQGNRHAEVRVHSFNQPGTFDEMSDRIIANKQGFNDVFWKSQESDTADVKAEDMPSAYDAAIELEQDPVKRRKLEIERDLAQAAGTTSQIEKAISNLAKRIRSASKNKADYEAANEAIDRRPVPAYEDQTESERKKSVAAFKKRMAEQREKNAVRIADLDTDINSLKRDKAQREAELTEHKAYIAGIREKYVVNGVVSLDAIKKYGDTKFSKQSTKSKGYSQQQALNQLAKEVPGIVPLLGQQVRVISEESAIKLAGNEAKGAQGFVVDDTIYFVHDNIDANTDLNGLALHEIAVHAMQLRKNYGEFTAILRQVEAMLAAGNKKMLEAQAMVPSDTKAEHKTEETLAYFVQANPNLPLAKRFMAWFRNALRAIGKTIKPLERVKFMRWANALTGEDLTYMAQQALKSAPTAMQFKGGRTKGVWFHAAWHGSPHDHDRFDSSKIGTGEGNQAFGYGLYFTDAKSIAEYYRDQLSNVNLILPNGKQIEDDRGASPSSYAQIHLKANNGDYAETRKDINTYLGDISGQDEFYRDVMRTLDDYEKRGVTVKQNKGKLYQVELAPEQDEYLDWNKPLSEQSEKVKEALEFSGLNLPDKKWNTGEFIYKAFPESLVGKSSNGLNAARSKYLHSLGIRGIRYKAEQGRSDASNYVIFSDDDVSITAKFSREQREAERQYKEIEQRYFNADGLEKPGAMLAPNGERSKLNKTQWIQVRTQNFKNWFGDWENNPQKASKVVDENGEPLVVYRGLASDFGPVLKPIDDRVYFTGDKLEASKYAEMRAKRTADKEAVAPNVISAFLNLKNPVPVDDLVTQDDYEQAGHDGMIYGGMRGNTYYAVDHENQVKSAIGNNGDFSKANNDIRFSKGIPPSIQSAKDKYLNKDTNIYRFQDRFIDLKRQIEKAVSSGNPLSADANPYKSEELYHQRLAARVDDFNKHELDPILKALKDQPTLEKFQKYLQAKHAPSRNAVMAERNPNQAMIDQYLDDAEQMLNYWELKIEEIKSRNHSKQELKDARSEYRQAMADVKKWRNAEAFKGTEDQRNSLSGMSNQQSRDFLRNLPAEERAKFDTLGAKVESITNKTLDLLVEYGMETQETVDTLRAQWQHYVPLYRDEAHSDDYTHPIGRGFSVRGSGLKSATGSNAEVTNILAHIAAQREQMLRRGEKNIVTQSIANFVEQYPDADFAEVDKKEFMQKLNDDGLVETNMTPQQVMLNNPNVVAFRVDGKNHYIVFNEDKPETMRLAASLQNMDGAQLNAFENFVAKGTRYMAAISTQYNVVFGLFNLMRDTGATALNLSTTKLKGDTGKVISGILPALKTIWQVERESGNPTDARLYKQFKMDGATTGFTQMFTDINHRNENLVKRIERLNKRLSLHDIGQFVTDYNTMMENATRFAAYKAAIAKGLSRSEAASIAKNITVNFNRKGSATTEISAAYAFFNASVQGTARMAETLKGEKGKQILMGGVALGVINTLLGIALMGDDDWEKIPEYDRERNLIIPYGNGDYGKIPMPLGFHIIPSIGRKLTEMAIGSNVKTPQARLLELFGEVADAFNPLGGGGNLMLVASPTVADPAISLAMNRDFKNTPISREDMNSLNPTPGFTRSKESATAFSKKMAELINKGTGGTNAKQGVWSPTADQIDYVFGQIFGGTGREAMRVSKTVESLASGEKPTLKDIPVAGRLLGETKGEEPERRAYYDNVRKLNEHEAEIKWMRQNGKGAEIGKYRAENPEANLVIMANHTESAIKKLKDRRNALKARDADSASIKLVDKMILKQMERLNQKVFDAQK